MGEGLTKEYIINQVLHSVGVSRFESVMVCATWMHPLVQSCLSPMAANQDGLKDHVPDGMLSAAGDRKPSTKWLE